MGDYRGGAGTIARRLARGGPVMSLIKVLFSMSLKDTKFWNTNEGSTTETATPKSLLPPHDAPVAPRPLA